MKRPEVKIYEPIEGVHHIIFADRIELSKTFCRLQEFYESPLEMCRQPFTRRKFLETYRAKWRGNYYEDWNQGFNVPGEVAMKWAETFEPDTHDQWLMEFVKAIKPRYMIGTPKWETPMTVEHEIFHALFYIDPDFKAEALARYDMLPEWFLKNGNKPDQSGYAEHVLKEETVAHFCTDTPLELSDTFKTIHLPWETIAVLQMWWHAELPKHKVTMKNWDELGRQFYTTGPTVIVDPDRVVKGQIVE